MLKAVIFDFDGTLADTAPAIVATMKHTFREMGLPEPEEDLIKSTIGLPLEGCCRISGNLDEAQVEVATRIYRRIFNDYAATHTKVYPGVVDTMNALAAKGLRLAIATSRGPNSLDLVLSTRPESPAMTDMLRNQLRTWCSCCSNAWDCQRMRLLSSVTQPSISRWETARNAAPVR